MNNSILKFSLNERIDIKSFSPTLARESVRRDKRFVSWGDDNDFPQYVKSVKIEYNDNGFVDSIEFETPIKVFETLTINECKTKIDNFAERLKDKVSTKIKTVRVLGCNDNFNANDIKKIEREKDVIIHLLLSSFDNFEDEFFFEFPEYVEF